MRLELQEKKLDELAEQISKLENADVVKSHLAKYFCVLVSGYLENVIKDSINEFHSGTCKKETGKFISSRVRNITNLDDDKLVNLLEAFSDSWGADYKAQRTDRMATALNSVYAQRNKIAHGDSYNSNITYTFIAEYYAEVKGVVSILRAIISR